MSDFPFLSQWSFLGQLHHLKTYLFYDFPRLFACGNTESEVFLALCVKEEDDCLEWICSSLTPQTEADFRRGKIDYRQAFLASKDSRVFFIRDEGNGEILPSVLACRNLTDDLLPKAGIRPAAEEGVIVPWNKDSLVLANQTEKGAANLVVDTPDVGGILANRAGKILQNLQSLLNALGQEASGFPLQKKIPPHIINQMRLRFTGTFPGSFGMSFEGTYKVDSAEHTLFEASCLKLSSVLSSAEKNCFDEALSLDHVSSIRLTSFVESLTSMESGFYFEYASPKKGKISTPRLSAENINSLYRKLNESKKWETEIEITGRIDGIFLSKKEFVIIDEDKKMYRGRIGTNAFKTASNVRINSLCRARLKVRYLQSKTKEEYIKEDYTLEEMSVLSDLSGLPVPAKR